MPLPVPSRSLSRSPEKKSITPASGTHLPGLDLNTNSRGKVNDNSQRNELSTGRTAAESRELERGRSNATAGYEDTNTKGGGAVKSEDIASTLESTSSHVNHLNNGIARGHKDDKQGDSKARSTNSSQGESTDNNTSGRNTEARQQSSESTFKRPVSFHGGAVRTLVMDRKPSVKASATPMTSNSAKRTSIAAFDTTTNGRTTPRESMGPPPSASGRKVPSTRSTPTSRTPSAATFDKRNADKRNSIAVTPSPTTSTSTASTPVKPSTRITSGHSSRPAFSTYQQHYSPAKRTPHATTGTTLADRIPPSAYRTKFQPDSLTTTSTLDHSRPESSPSSPYSLPSNPRMQRERLNLLHLSLLHSQAANSQKYRLKTAHNALHTSHNSLRQLHHDVLALERSTRQHRNILALHRWSSGNNASLSRRLGTLVGVLSELAEITGLSLETVLADTTRADATTSQPVAENAGNTATHEEQHPSAYETLVAQFTHWIAWVRDVWALRDAAVDAISAGQNHIENGNNDDITDPDAAATRDEALSFAIEPLGDAFKASLRALSSQMHSLSVRVDDLVAAPVPAIEEPVTNAQGQGEDSGEASVESTAGALLALADALVKGMREELQVMREVEFEVLEGERAWLEERTRMAREEVEGGFGTPSARW